MRGVCGTYEPDAAADAERRGARPATMNPTGAKEMRRTDGFVLGEAETGHDEETVAVLMTEYLEWGHQRHSERYGGTERPG